MEGLRCGFNRAPDLLLEALKLSPDTNVKSVKKEKMATADAQKESDASGAASGAGMALG